MQRSKRNRKWRWRRRTSCKARERHRQIRRLGEDDGPKDQARNGSMRRGWTLNSILSLCHRMGSPCRAPIPRIPTGLLDGSNHITRISHTMISRIVSLCSCPATALPLWILKKESEDLHPHCRRKNRLRPCPGQLFLPIFPGNQAEVHKSLRVYHFFSLPFVFISK